MAGKYTGYSLQYLRRLLRNGKLGGIKIGQLRLVDKGALDACFKRVQNTADQRFGPKSLFYFPVDSTDETVEETSKSIR